MLVASKSFVINALKERVSVQDLLYSNENINILYRICLIRNNLLYVSKRLSNLQVSMSASVIKQNISCKSFFFLNITYVSSRFILKCR